MSIPDLETLRPYATARQWGVLTSAECPPSVEPAKSILYRLRKKAARKDPDLHVDKAPEGYHLRGASTLVRGDGTPVLQWRKTAKDVEDIDTWARALEHAIDACSVRPATPAVFLPPAAGALCNVLPVGDPHFGMLAWPKETGAPWDLKIAAETHRKAIEHLLLKAPTGGTALVVWMGDNMHADDSTGLTPASKHKLDTDSRWERSLEVLFAAMINSVEVALLRHQRVVVRIVKGNHDPHVSAGLALALEAYYRDTPAVEIERAPTPLFVTTWGRVLLAFAHGHAPPPERVAGILASDYRKEIGETEQGYLYTGHLHSKVLRETGGLIMEAVQTLGARDAYATHAGFRSARGLFVDTFHRERLAPVQRLTISAEDL